MEAGLAGNPATAGKPTIGIIGASGIGKHHAKWYAMEGCRVVAFVGSSAQSLERTRDAMRKIMDFRGQGYTDVNHMLSQHPLAAVSVCSPHHLHREHTLACLRAGLHVLCEKPLVWDVEKPPSDMLADAASMIAAAERAGRMLAVNMQYVAAIKPYLELYAKHRGPLCNIERLHFRMESKGGASGPNQYDEIWIDLASHPLSLALRLLPDAFLVCESATCVIRRHEVKATFKMETPLGTRIPVIIELRNIYEGPMVRRFGVNGFAVDLAGANDERGVYRTHISLAGSSTAVPAEGPWTGDDRVQCEDLVHTSVRRFAEAVRGKGQPLVTSAEAYRNLELQLALLAVARREGP